MKMTQQILKYVVLAGVFIIPFIAFLTPSGMFFPFITGKGFTFRILVEVMLGAYAILALLNPTYRPKLSWITKAMLFFGGAILVADLLGVNSYKSLWSNYERMEGFVLIAHLLAYYFVVSSVFVSRIEWNRFFNTSIIASVIMSFYSILQLAGKITINQGGVRVDGTFGNATYLAIYLVFHIFLSIYMLVSSATKAWQKWAYGTVILLETIILYYTATRGAILGLIGGLLLTGILLAWRERGNKKVQKIAFGLVGGVILLVGGFLAIRGTTFVAESPVLSRFSTLGPTEIRNQGRYYVWPMALKGVAERPIFGWGQENFNFVFNKYYDPGLFGQEEWFDRTHNIVLDWLIAGGIVGFAAYASMYVAMFYYIWRKESVLTLSERSVFTGMIAAYIFHNMFVFDNLISYILFFSLLAYIHSISVARGGETSAFYTKTLSKGASYGAMAGIIIVTLGAAYFVNYPAYKANKTLIQAMMPQQAGVTKNLELFKQVYAYNSFGSGEATEHLTQVTSQISSPDVQIPPQVKQQFYDFNKQKIEEKVASSPKDARYLVFAGSFFNKFGQYDEAIKYLERALVESPNKQSIYFELGASYLGKGDTAKMFQLFKTAYELKPESPESQIIYAVGAIYTRNKALETEMISKIDPELVIKDNRFLRAYAYVEDTQAVLAILEERMRLDPSDKQNKLSLASTYASLGRRQEAIAIIREIMAEDPTFVEQGEVYIKQIQSGELER